MFIVVYYCHIQLYDTPCHLPLKHICHVIIPGAVAPRLLGAGDAVCVRSADTQDTLGSGCRYNPNKCRSNNYKSS